MAHRDPAREAGSLQREAALVLRGEVAELGLDVAVLPQAPVLRVGGFATPYPPSRMEEHYLPDLDRVLDAVDRSLAF